MYQAYLGLGSNSGDRLQYLQRAIDGLGALVCIEQISALYETQPVGMESDHPFYNMAVHCSTELEPVQLLHSVKHLERKLGRSPGTHLQDREIDIDILLYENIYYEDDELQVPHPELHHRRFALEPLNDIAGDVVHPVFGEKIGRLLGRCRNGQRVVKLSERILLPYSKA